MKNKPDKARSTGAYVSSTIYVGAAQIFKIETVAGNGAVESIELTRKEAKAVVKGLEQELKDGKRGRYDE